MENFVFVIIITALACFFLTNLGWIFYFILFRKKPGIFSSKTEATIEGCLAEQKKTLARQKTEIAKITDDVARLKEVSLKTLQKVSLVRFNPFGEMGGNQSFSIALLDAQDNGFVITGLYGREVHRIYAKPIKQGSSEYPLSDEEKRAIEEAMS